MIPNSRWLPIIGSFLFIANSTFSAEPGDLQDPLPPGAKARLGTMRMRDPGTRWNGAALSSDGKYLITPSPTGLFRTDIATGLPADKGAAKPLYGVGRVELSADGKRAGVVEFGKTIVRDVASGKILAEYDRKLPYTGVGVSLSADGKLIALGGVRDEMAKDKPVTAIVVDVEKKAKLAEVAVLQNQSAAVALSPDGKTLMTWGDHYEQTPPGATKDPDADPSRIVQFWNVENGKETGRAIKTGFTSPAIAFAPDGRTVAIGNGQGIIRILDVKSRIEKHSLFGRGDQGTQLAFSPDGKTLASTGGDGSVQMWNPITGMRVGLIDCPFGSFGNYPRGIVFVASDRAVVWAVSGMAAVVWEVPSGKILSIDAGHTSDVTSISFTADGKEIVSGSLDGTVQRWEASGKALGEMHLRSNNAGNIRGMVTVLPGGAVAIADRGNGPAVYELASGRQLFSTLGAGTFNTRTFFAPDGVTLLTLAPTPYPAPKVPLKFLAASVWDTTIGRKLTDLHLPVGDLQIAIPSPDRTKLITGTRVDLKNNMSELAIRAWNLADGKKLAETSIALAGFGSNYLVPASDNRTAVAVLGGTKVAVFDYVEGKLGREIETERLAVSCSPVFSADGKSIALGLTQYGQPGTIRVYNWESGKIAHSFKGHSMMVASLAFSPDGKTLASGSGDSTILLWDLAGK